MTTNNRYLAEEYRGRINRVLDHIERNMDRPFTLEELADIANFSKFHFSRIFWAMTGETPFGFLMRIRLEKAASLLLMNPKESISEIAYLCGYSSLLFSRGILSPTSIYRPVNGAESFSITQMDLRVSIAIIIKRITTQVKQIAKVIKPDCLLQAILASSMNP